MAHRFYKPSRYCGSALLAALFVQVAATSCGDDDGGSPAALGKDAGTDSGQVIPVPPSRDAGQEAGPPLGIFDAWREMLAVTNQSPDQRLARADEVVQAKNAQRIFEFVRDDIATYPPTDTGFARAVTAQRWGVRGTLRGGAGTPREKVELLLWLYDRAGIVAEAVSGTPDSSLDGKRILFRDFDPKLQITPAAGQVDRWREALGQPATLPSRPLIDQNGSQRNALATSLLAKVPSPPAVTFDFTLGDIPLVRVNPGANAKYANPLVPTAKYGESLTTSQDLQTAPAAETPPAIKIKVEAVRANAAFERFTVIENTYDASAVVGRKVNLSFPPPVSAENLATTRIDSVTNFVPLLSVAGTDTTLEERNTLAKTGNPLTLGGDVYTYDPDTDAVTVNGVALPSAASGTADKVTDITATADPATFPEVTIRVSAKDGDGKGVPHLGSGDIGVKEGDTGVSYAIVQNEAPPPRIALLFDTSTSIPDAFRGAPAVALGKSFTSQLYTKYPNAQVRVGTVWFGANWLGNGWATSETDANTQVDAVATAPGTSELWDALGDAADENPTLTVIITDGDASEAATAQDRARIAGGPPVLALGVGTVKQTGLDAMAELSGGSTGGVANATAAIAAAFTALDAQGSTDYVIRYQAPADGLKSRTVTVTINGKTVEVPYTVPDQPATPGALAGLYLTIEVGDRSYTRALAGVALGASTAQPEITEAQFADVRSMLRGRVTLDLEGASPSPSIVLSEYLADRLSLEPLMTAFQDKNKAAIIAALKDGVMVTPGTLPLASPPVASQWTKDTVTFETAPRITSLVQKVNLGGPVTRAIDIWPLSRWSTASLDPDTAFEQTLKATSALAVTEAGLFPAKNTIKALDGVKLTAVEAGAARDQVGLTDVQRRTWAFLEESFVGKYTLLVPHDPGAFWAIEKTTGTVIGVLPDGSGGSLGSSCDSFNDANSMIDALSLMGSLAGASVGGWALLAKWEVKYVTVADIVLNGGSASIPPGGGDLTNPAGDMACGIVDDALGNAFPALGAYETLNGALGLGGFDTGAPGVCDGFGGGICE